MNKIIEFLEEYGLILGLLGMMITFAILCAYGGYQMGLK